MHAILNSWKEIAAYVGKGVRTVQRWERLLGFPVRRPHAHKHSTVMAFTSEIDAWLMRSGTLAPASRPRDIQSSGLYSDTISANAPEVLTKPAILQPKIQRAGNFTERSHKRNAS
jgi:hypothetical protein